MEGNKVFLAFCIKLSHGIQPKKLKQLKFLLQDVMENASVLKDSTFLEVIGELENQNILQRSHLRGQDGRLLCEILDALSLTEFANGICQDFDIERDSTYQSVITPYRKLLVILSDNLNETRYLEGMACFLKDAGYDILQDSLNYDAVEIFQAMEYAKLMSSDNLSLLKEMLNSLSRLDLVDKIEELNKDCRVKKAYGLRYLPPDMIQRKPELDAVLDLLNSGGSTVGVVGVRNRDIVGIRGMGGIGKTVLAQAVAWRMCSNREVIWLDIGQTPDRLALVNTLVKALGGTRSFSDLPAAQSWIREETKNKNFLVVLDDVWNVDDAYMFDVLAGNCQLLITTRDADVVRGLRGSTIYELGTMGKEAARRLLYQSAQVQSVDQLKSTENFPRVVEGLLEECRGLPLALALVGSSLVDTRNVQGWQDVLDDLKKADLESVRSCFPKDAYPYDHLLAAIDVSFQRLEGIHQEKFLDFAIFPEDTDIPSSILEMYWTSVPVERRRCSSLSARQARSILNVLERRSMIQKSPSADDGKTKAYRVHDLLLDFTRGKLRQMGHRLNEVQANFLAIFLHQCENGDWSRFPEDNEYFFTYLPYHLCHAEKLEDLLGLFFNFEWLQRKVEVTSLASLISDFRFLDCTSGVLKLLKSSLMLSADVLDQRSIELGAQLLGRLHSCSEENPSVMKLLDQVREYSSKKRLLIPLHSCLTEPDGPLIKIFTRHSDTVFSLVTADRVSGTIVISASSDQLIKVNELETGRELKVLKGHKMAVYCLALSHDETMLASGSYDTTARIWNLDSYVEVQVLEGRGGYVNALDFSADDTRLFTGSNDGSLKVWSVVTGVLLQSLAAHDVQIRGLCTTMDGVLVATASLDNTIKLWHTENVEPVATLSGHTAAVYAVVSTRDSAVLVSASGDKIVKVWDTKTYKELRSLCGHEEEVYSVSVTRDGQRVLSGGKDMVVRLWFLVTGELLFCFRGHSHPIRFVTTTPDGSKALSGSQDTTFRVWKSVDTRNIKQSEFSGHSKDVMDISVNDKGSVCASSSFDGTVKIWRCETGKEIHTLRGHTRRVVSLAMTSDGAYIASLAKDSFIKVWDLEHGQMLAAVEMPEPRLVRFNQTHDLVLVGCEGNKLFIWNWRNTEIPAYRSVSLPAFTTMEMAIDQDTVYTISSSSEVCKVDLTNNNVSMLRHGPCVGYKSVVMLPDGQATLAGIHTNSSFIYWEMSSSREILYNSDYPRETLVTAIAITNDEKRVISGNSTGSLSQIHLKQSSTIIQNYENTRVGKGIRFVAVLKNDHHFVFVDETNTVELRSLDDTERVVLGRPASQVTSVCSIGSQFLLVGCKNGELVFFDTVKARDAYQGHDGAVTQLASNTKDHFLFFVSGSENGSVKFWLLTNTTPRVWYNLWFLEHVHAYPVTALAFVPGSEDVVSGSYDNVMKRINKSGIVKEYSFQCYDVPALCVVDDSLIATFVRSLSVVKWDVHKGGRFLSRIHGGAGREQVARIFLPSGHVVSKGSHHSLVYWELKSGNRIRTLRGHTHDIRALAFVPRGAFLLSGSRDKVLKLWNMKTGDLVDEFHFERFVVAISCASNGIVCVGLQGGQVCFMRVNNLTDTS